MSAARRTVAAQRRRGAIVVFTACPDGETAARIARALVVEGLVGCAQILNAPIRSLYRWQGELHEEAETLLLLKATAAAWPRLRGRLVALHPYDVPEILACAAQGHAPYLKWLREASPAPQRPRAPARSRRAAR